METRTDLSPPIPIRKNARNESTIKEDAVLSTLPAHVWIQGDDKTILYSNRLKLGKEDTRSPKRCYECFKGKKKPCSCCKSGKIRKTLCPEKCECKRNGNVYSVYHFPYLANDNSIQVIKFEIDETDISSVQKKSVTVNGFEKITNSFLRPPNEFLGICASCKKIRDDSTGKWVQNEVYLRDHFDIEFSHGVCPSCAVELYPTLFPMGTNKD